MAKISNISQQPSEAWQRSLPHLYNSCNTSNISAIIGSVNGEEWIKRRQFVPKIVTSQVQESLSKQQSNEGLQGQGVYASASLKVEDQHTNYDIVNAWQVNFVRGVCDMDGMLLSVNESCWSDDAMFKSFYSSRLHPSVLDVGCNTGKNMIRALKYGGEGTEAFGIEFSQDSVTVAQQALGKDRVFRGDASAEFVDNYGWSRCFSAVQCTAVLQHLTPQQVNAAMANMSKCLKPGGEVLLTFKDAPTRQSLISLGMESWADEVFTADIVDRESYLANGFLRAVMWDDDYYPAVTTQKPPTDRDTSAQGLHCREFVFYSLAWMKEVASKHGLVAIHVEAHPDSKIPLSAFHWMVIFRHNGPN